MTPLLYIGAANFVQPSTGMDIGSRCHLEELFDDGRFAMTAISVSPSAFDPAGRPSRPTRMFGPDIRPDIHKLTGKLQLLALKLGLLARGGILYQTGFVSTEARAAIRANLAERPALLIIDHINAMANLSIWQLLWLRLRGNIKIVAVSHDISSMLLLDRAAIHTSRWKSFAIRLHALHAHAYETVVFWLAHRVWFVSTDDRQNFRRLDPRKSGAACQIIEWPEANANPALATEFGQYLVFVGSPSFFPNGAAIDWIADRFAPELRARMPALKILLVGKGTEGVNVAAQPNLHRLGFVDDHRLNQLVHGATGVLSPVVHGAGIKIKVLEAIAAGCAIFATDHSLRGYEFMQIKPLLDIDDPARSAQNVAATVGDADVLTAFRARIGQRWAEYKRFRRGRFADFVHGLVAAPAVGARGSKRVRS